MTTPRPRDKGLVYPAGQGRYFGRCLCAVSLYPSDMKDIAICAVTKNSWLHFYFQKKAGEIVQLGKYPPIERTPDGSLPRMTTKQHREAVKLIRRRCCNCDHGNCLLLDDGDEVVCPQTLTHSVCCTYFRHVLLHEPEAQALYAALFNKDDLRRCVRCGKSYASHGNRAKYCDGCKLIVQREQKAEYARKRRAERRKIDA